MGSLMASYSRLRERVRLLAHRLHWGRAIRRWSQVLAGRDLTDSQRAMALLVRAGSYLSRGRPGDLERALADYDRAQPLSAGMPDLSAYAYVLRAGALARRDAEGDTANVIADYTAALRLRSEADALLAGAAVRFGGTGEGRGRHVSDRSLAIRHGLGTWPKYPPMPWVDILLTRAYYLLKRAGPGDLDLAMVDCNAALAEAGLTSEQRHRARSYRCHVTSVLGGRWEPDQALTDSDAVLADSTSRPGFRIRALSNRAYAFIRRGGDGDYERAASDYEVLLSEPSLTPDQRAGFLINRAYAYSKRGADGDFDCAVADCTEAIGLQSAADKYRAHALAGRCAVFCLLGGPGDAERAIDDGQAVLAMQGVDTKIRAGTMFNLACAHALLGDAAMVADWLRKSDALKPLTQSKLDNDRCLRPVKDTPEYQAFVATLPPGGED